MLVRGKLSHQLLCHAARVGSVSIHKDTLDMMVLRADGIDDALIIGVVQALEAVELIDLELGRIEGAVLRAADEAMSTGLKVVRVPTAL